MRAISATEEAADRRAEAAHKAATEALTAALPEREEAIEDVALRVLGESKLRDRMRSGQPLGAR